MLAFLLPTLILTSYEPSEIKSVFLCRALTQNNLIHKPTCAYRYRTTLTFHVAL